MVIIMNKDAVALMLFYLSIVIMAKVGLYFLVKVKKGQILDFITWINLIFALALVGGIINSFVISSIVGFMVCYMYLKKLDQWSSRKVG